MALTTLVIVVAVSVVVIGVLAGLVWLVPVGVAAGVAAGALSSRYAADVRRNPQDLSR